jgi:hypothetical protein
MNTKTSALIDALMTEGQVPMFPWEQAPVPVEHDAASIFIAVAKGEMTAREASRRTGVTRAFISKQIRKLKQKHGIPPYDRTP